MSEKPSEWRKAFKKFLKWGDFVEVHPQLLKDALDDVAALEAELETAQYGIANLEHYWISPMEYEKDRAKWSKRVEGLEDALEMLQ